MLDAEQVSFTAGRHVLLHATSLAFGPGCFHVIMGANGAGKSTLLKLLAGEQPPSSGRVVLDGKALAQYTRKELAMKRAVLSQHYHLNFPTTVRDLVLMGRYPYFSAAPKPADLDICRQAMQLMNVAELAGREYGTLSGGEAQKVQMSRVLAQIWAATEGAAQLLFLDEPVSHLDVGFQHQLLQAAKDLSRKNTTVIAILHDINLALAFADRILFMKQGRVLHDVQQASGVSTAIIKEIFDVDASIVVPQGHRPVIIF